MSPAVHFENRCLCAFPGAQTALGWRLTANNYRLLGKLGSRSALVLVGQYLAGGQLAYVRGSRRSTSNQEEGYENADQRS
jgi:hypothetical protein